MVTELWVDLQYLKYWLQSAFRNTCPLQRQYQGYLVNSYLKQHSHKNRYSATALRLRILKCMLNIVRRIQSSQAGARACKLGRTLLESGNPGTKPSRQYLICHSKQIPLSCNTLSVHKFSRWLRTDQFFLSTLLFKIYLVILSGAYLLLSGAADSQNHWKTAERGQSYTKERGANLVVSFIFIAISSLRSLHCGTEWRVAIGRGSRIQKAPNISKIISGRQQSSRCSCTQSSASLSGST